MSSIILCFLFLCFIYFRDWLLLLSINQILQFFPKSEMFDTYHRKSIIEFLHVFFFLHNLASTQQFTYIGILWPSEIYVYLWIPELYIWLLFPRTTVFSFENVVVTYWNSLIYDPLYLVFIKQIYLKSYLLFIISSILSLSLYFVLMIRIYSIVHFYNGVPKSFKKVIQKLIKITNDF